MARRRTATSRWRRGRSAGLPIATARVVLRIQENGRCEGQNAHGDTYGPVTYQGYLPGYAIFGWQGKGDPLHAAHFTAIVFDLACLFGLVLVGLRYGDRRLAATLAFAWAAYPFTQYVASSSSNDAIQPALLVFGFWLASSPWGRGSLAALASWTKFAPLVVAPLWATYPERRVRPTAFFAAAFAAATLAAFWVLLLEPDPLGAVRTVWDRTIAHQFGRESPFSLWDWRQYHAGLPDLHLVQRALQLLLLAGAVALAFVPRRKSPLQLAALTAALLIGFEIVLTHWFYLYVAWFFPFVAFAILAPERAEGGSAAALDPRWWRVMRRSCYVFFAFSTAYLNSRFAFFSCVGVSGTYFDLTAIAFSFIEDVVDEPLHFGALEGRLLHVHVEAAGDRVRPVLDRLVVRRHTAVALVHRARC